MDNLAPGLVEKIAASAWRQLVGTTVSDILALTRQ
jgi:hypothetical protein